MNGGVKGRLLREQREREELRLVRRLLPSSVGAGREAVIGRERLLNFGSNDYLGLASHPALAAAAAEAAARYGFGSGGSRMLGGDLEEHHALEEEVARSKKKDRAVLLNSGYSANLAVMTALATPQTHIFADRLVHASLIDGILLSGGRLHRFRHNDPAHLEELLGKVEGEKIVVTESVFSMDGDRAPLREICDLAEKYGAITVVDEAHADGVLGPRGGGWIEELGLEERVDVTVSTFGKAYGSFGAAAVGSEWLIDAVVQKGRAFIYTTALPASVAAATRCAVARAQAEPWRRERALALAERFRSAVAPLGFSTLESSTQIVPVVIGSSGEALRASRTLREKGIWVPAVREPTVPTGTARLRINWTALHTDGDFDRLVGALGELAGQSEFSPLEGKPSAEHPDRQEGR